jgi:uncharacterized protein with von Willebrand factor type A (vWA) domain
MESTTDKYLTTIDARYFDIKDYVCVQLSTNMTGDQYQALTGIIPGQELLGSTKKDRAMILCLDKSGSMAGTAFNALKQGAGIVATQVNMQKEFQTFITLFYDTSAKVYECKTDRDFAQYENELTKHKAGGSTSFVEVFNYINKYLKSDGKLKDVSIIFFTDGQDTCSDKK